MIGKLNRLPVGTQHALHQPACLGSLAEIKHSRSSSRARSGRFTPPCGRPIVGSWSSAWRGRRPRRHLALDQGCAGLHRSNWPESQSPV